MAVALVVAALANPAGAEAPFSGQVVLSLDGGVAGLGKEPDPREMQVYLTCENGKWVDAWGWAPTFNKAMHEAKVVSAEVTADRVRLKVEMAVGSDPWVKGGPARFDVDLKRNTSPTGEQAWYVRSSVPATGAMKPAYLEGTFTGTLGSGRERYEGKGRAHGLLLPLPPLAPDFAPVKPGEHPRLLFRKSDLSRLRERMKTPLGRAVIEKLKASSEPVALGLMYQLTGEKRYADRAFLEADKIMADRSQGAFALGRAWGYKTTPVGLAYDLCYDAWTVEQRSKTENYFDDTIDMCLYRQHTLRSVNWTPGSNYVVVIHAGNGIASLAIQGEKIHPPARPIAPRSEAPRINPPKDYTPGKGVPVVKMVPGKMPTEWLKIGPFNLHYTSPKDPLGSVGGVAGVRPQVGDEVTFRSQIDLWKPLSDKNDPTLVAVSEGTGPVFYGVPKGTICLVTPRIADGREQTRLFFFTVLKVEEPGYYRFKANFWQGRCFLAGERLLDGEIGYLSKGRYPMMVPVVIGAPTGTARPFFVEATEADARQYYADPKHKKAYEAAMQAWQPAYDQWKAGGGINPQWTDYAKQTARWNLLSLIQGMGEGGFQGEGEGYTLECHHVIHDYAYCHRNVFGRMMDARPTVGYFVPRYIMTSVWHERAQPGTYRISNQTFTGGGTADDKYLARAYTLVPEKWRPVVLWHWHRMAGISDEEVGTEAGIRKLVDRAAKFDIMVLVHVFLDYPLDARPVSPAKLFPRIWEAKTRGFCVFRNGFSGGNDIVAQITGKGMPCGWNSADAGCFQICGLGHAWAQKTGQDKGASREENNVVLLPDAPVSGSGLAKVVHFQGDEKTGCGSVTYSMDDVYRPDEAEAGKEQVRGLRAFAADYSGKSGAPALFAIVDKIAGGKRKVWTWHVPVEEGTKIAVQGNTFTITNGTTSMKGTFLSPAGAAITLNGGTLNASGADPTAGDFFVVVTLQRGKPPAVSVFGKGLDAVATVGRQRVRFDGRKLIVQR